MSSIEQQSSDNFHDIDPFEQVVIAAWRSRALLRGAIPLFNRDAGLSGQASEVNLAENNPASAVVTALLEIENGLINPDMAKAEIVKANQSYSAPKSILQAAMEANMERRSDVKGGGVDKGLHRLDNEVYSIFIDAFKDETDEGSGASLEFGSEQIATADELGGKDSETKGGGDLAGDLSYSYEDESIDDEM